MANCAATVYFGQGHRWAFPRWLPFALPAFARYLFMYWFVHGSHHSFYDLRQIRACSETRLEYQHQGGQTHHHNSCITREKSHTNTLTSTPHTPSLPPPEKHRISHTIPSFIPSLPPPVLTRTIRENRLLEASARCRTSRGSTRRTGWGGR